MTKRVNRAASRAKSASAELPEAFRALANHPAVSARLLRTTVSFSAMCVALAFGPSTARADASWATCSLDGTTYTCTNLVTEFSLDLSDVDDTYSEIVFEDIVVWDIGDYLFDIGNPGEEGSSHGDDGEDLGGLVVVLDADGTTIPFYSDDTVPIVSLETTGGAGHSGKDRTDSDTSGQGGNSGDGGNVTGTQLLWIVGGTLDGSTYASAAAAGSLISQGGDSYSGGDGRVYGTDNATGGDAGDAGDANVAEFVIYEDASISLISDVDDLPGIYVLSAGGAGGDGGKAKGGTNAYGGDGGQGGDAGEAIFIAEGTAAVTIETQGDAAHGIEVLSAGGDGGDGGKGEDSLCNAYGGDGGGGGTGGKVTVSVNDEAWVDITTTGENAIGILARSYGGAGGDGGDGDSDFAAGKGGSNDVAGPAGDVSVTFQGSITTTGEGTSTDDAGDDFETTSSGILAQSVGGFAGDAGDASGNFTVYGASSESAGDASTVTVEIASGTTITTGGAFSDAIEAQSIGGGGGKGGSSSGIATVGGEGSAGGDGGEVTVTVDGGDDTLITTTGVSSAGISAQSIGGGGGKSGGSSGFSAIGGSGGEGGDSDTVDVTLNANISTDKDYSEGVFAQSIGGGGGKAASNSGLIDTIGATAGNGGASGSVTFTHEGGDITTNGEYATGVDLQSVGGAGGKGLSTTSVGVEFSLTIGSTGGDGGDGGEVTYLEDDSDSYDIETSGTYAYGISAQSGGGGGGKSGGVTNVTASVGIGISVGVTEDGGGGGNGAAVTVGTSANITTDGEHSDAISAQSYGGSGGKVGNTISVNDGLDSGAVSVATGGAGGDGGDGSTVDVTSSGTILTKQDHSNGIFAQSSGGSGGKSSSIYAINSISAESISVSVGATGGAGGDASDVTVSNTGAITTEEVNSTGIYAQSQGGGGGASGTTMSFDAISVQGSVSVAVGGDGGDGGSSGEVKVTNYGTLQMDKDNSDGIFAQSIAGGGGNSGLTVSGTSVTAAAVDVAVGGNAGDGDTSERVVVENYGAITVDGMNAYAIYAESRGGSGGKSGNIMDLDLLSGGNVGVAVGGEGGDGGTSGAVEVTNEGTLSATDEDAGYGILALSQGGEGGNSGTVVNVTGFSSDTVATSVGGGGGDGGTASYVSVYNAGDITTAADLGSAITAQSIGGSGGNAGTVLSADLSAVLLNSETSGVSGDVTVSVGGDGGDGGVSGSVAVQNFSSLSTGGEKAYGVLAQSIGGNGGNGGSIYELNIDSGNVDTANVSVSVGGSGAGGASASWVEVFNYDSISTTGAFAHGIVGQSIGGSGGNGGSVHTYTLALTSEFSWGYSFSIGGEGGDGSVGNTVYVENEADITTSGKGAKGISALSLGGDGGDGGSAVALIIDGELSDGGMAAAITGTTSVGGYGGDGSVADKVTFNNSGAITTSGASGDGIKAQSVGGGGGDGGDASATSVSVTSILDGSESLGVDLSFSIGGTGGYGGDSGEVEVTNDGTITTTQGAALGIFAQSVGGGGGSGGQSGSSEADYSSWTAKVETIATDVVDDLFISTYSVYSLVSNYKNYLTSWSLTVGGSGGAAGDGDAVDVTNTNLIKTSGDDATGIKAQSVGGGGGDGGAGTSASISTKLTLGGDGGAGGHGSTVTVENSGNIETGGSRAHGIWAQSVGGGGGDAGDVEGAFGASLADAFDVNVSLNIGASGNGDEGNGGDGGTVEVTHTDADIQLSGTDSVGIFAQSVGGGGGTAGSYSLTTYWIASNGDEGDSGDVTVTLDGGGITATEDYSIGIFAQSSSGSYGTSDFEDDDDTTYFKYDGDDSYDAGDVTITLEDGALVAVSGEMSRGILAASSGWDTSGAITISVDEDSSLTGGNGNAHIIELYDGSNNSITNYGLIEDSDFTDTSRTDDIYVIRTKTTSDDYDSTTASGNAVLTVDNYGAISGAIKLREKNSGSTFNNHADGTFNLGTTIDLGDGNGLLSNDGILSPGGVDTIWTATISDGDLEQSSTGTLLVDLDMNGSDGNEEADLLIADSIPTFDGSIEVNVIASDDVEDGDSGSIFVVVADKLDGDAGLSALDSAIVDYQVTVETDTDITVDDTTYSGKDGVLLSYTVDVGSSGASVNTSNLSSYLTSSSDTEDDDTSTADTASQTLSFYELSTTETDESTGVEESGDSGESAEGAGRNVKTDMKTVHNDLLNAKTTDDLEQLAAAHVLDETSAAIFAARHTSQATHNTLRSCPNLQRDGTASFLKEQNCTWFEAVGTNSRYDNETGITRLDERTFGLSLGGQRITDRGLILGGVFRAEDVTLTSDGAQLSGERFTLGAVLKKEVGPVTYSFSAAYGRQNLDQTRAYTVGGTQYIADANLKSEVLSADARVTYLHDFNPAYLRVGLGLGAYHSWQDGFTETGTGTMNWSVDASSQTDVILRPSLEVGRTFGTNDEIGRMYLNVGVAHLLSDPDHKLHGRLVGSGTSGTLAHQFTSDRTTAEIGVGFDLQPNENLRVSLRGDTKFSDNTSGGSVSASLSWNF